MTRRIVAFRNIENAPKNVVAHFREGFQNRPFSPYSRFRLIVCLSFEQHIITVSYEKFLVLHFREVREPHLLSIYPTRPTCAPAASTEHITEFSSLFVCHAYP
jgi:hypothetical protein